MSQFSYFFCYYHRFREVMAAFFERYMKPLEKIDPNDVCAAMIWFVVLQLDFSYLPIIAVI